jgi:hypothetical protein
MKSNDLLKYKHYKGFVEVRPLQTMISHWCFTEETEEEALLAHAMALVAEKSNMSANDLQHLFPYVLRMLKSDSNWAK